MIRFEYYRSSGGASNQQSGFALGLTSASAKPLIACCVIVVCCAPVLSQESVVTLTAGEDGVNAVCFSFDGRILAACTGKFVGLLQEPRAGRIAAWELPTYRVLASFAAHRDGISCVSFVPQSDVLARRIQKGTIQKGTGPFSS